MVDLVKLRKKKAKQDGESGVGSREPEQQVRESGVGSRELEQCPASEPIVVNEPMPAAKKTREAGEASVSLSEPVVARSKPAAVTPTPDPRQTISDTAKLDHFKQIAGKRREGFVEQEAETSSVDQIELLSFMIAGEQYAVSIDHLVEIVTPRSATQVPNADPTIVGIISLRGTIVTVIDVRRKLRHPPAVRGNDSRIIVAERGSETLGFEVDRVLRVLKVASAAIEPHPVVHSSELSEAVGGVFRHANALTILLDLDKLLA